MIGKATYKVRLWAICLLLTAFAADIRMANAQNKPALEYQVKAAFLFNFTRFVHWPTSAYASADAPFVIGIVGADPFGTYLDDLVNGEQVDGHSITIKRYPLDCGDLAGCQMVFVVTEDQNKTRSILSQTPHQGTLTVGDADIFMHCGGMIRFFKDDNRIKIEVKLALAKAAQLEISAKLLQVAKVK